MARSNSRSGSNRGRNNNPSGRNQYSDWGVMELARERPFAAAAAAAGAAAAGLFLWSRRSQISNQLSNLSDQIGEWTESMTSGDSGSWSSSSDDTGGLATGQTGSSSRSSSRPGMGLSETGGGNASFGASSGGSGTGGSSTSGRNRSKPTTGTATSTTTSQ